MFCENCGIDLQDLNQKFCPKCGIPLRKKIFELDEFGKYRRLNTKALDPTKVLLIVDEDLRKIFIWNGSNSPVRKRFIVVRVAQELQAELGIHYKIVSVDQGDASEFLKAFGMRSNDVEGSQSQRDRHLVFNSKEGTFIFREEYEPVCKHCGIELVEGQAICHECRKKVI